MNIYDINGVIIDTNNDPLVSISMIESLGIIGDSYASGEIYNQSTEQLEDHYQLSWGEVIGRMCGINVDIYAAGGLTSKTWLTDSYGLAKMNNAEPNNLYLIALGINDSSRLTLGTVSDIESDSNDTFYSYYGRIIRAVRSHAPNAIIILSTIALYAEKHNTFSAAIRNIGSHYDLSVIDLADNSFFKSQFFTDNKIMYHPTALNYSAMGKEYKKLIEDVLQKDISKYGQYFGLT